MTGESTWLPGNLPATTLPAKAPTGPEPSQTDAPEQDPAEREGGLFITPRQARPHGFFLRLVEHRERQRELKGRMFRV